MDNFAQQIQDMQRRLAQTQQHLGELSLTQQPEVIAAALEELNNDLEALKIASQLNIQDCQQALELAEQSSAEISQIFNMLPCFIWKFCPSTYQFIYASEVMTELSGIPREEFLQNPQIWDAQVDVGAESQDALKVAWEAITKGEPYRVTYLFYTLHGESRWFEVTARPAQEDGVLYYYGCTTDITEHWRTEQAQQQAIEALHLSEKRFRLAIEHFPDGTFVIYDAQRRLQFVNAHGVRLGGLPESEVLGHTDEEIHPPEITNAYLPTLQTAVETRTSQTTECTITLPTIGKITFIVTYVPLLNEQGDIYQILGITHDITERKQAEEALQQSEAQFRTLVANIPGVVYRCALTLPAQGMFISDAIEELSGYRPCDFTYEGTCPFTTIIYPQDVQRVNQTIEAALQTRHPFTLEYRIIHKDGSLRWVYEKGQGIFGEQGELLWMDGVIFDVSDRKWAESALQTQKDFLQAIIDTNPNYIYVKDLQGKYVLINEAVANSYGRSTEEIIGKTVTQLYLEQEFIEIADPSDQEVLKTGATLCIPIQSYCSLNGEARWIQTIKKPLRSKEGKIEYILGVSTDVTELKRIQQTLQAQKDFLQTIIDTNPNLIYVKDIEGRILLTNQACADFCGMTVAELVGKTPEQACPDSAEAKSFKFQDLEIITTRQPKFISEESMLSSTGEMRWFQSVKKPLFSQEEQVVKILGVCTDITERKLAEMQVQESLREKEVLLQEIHHRVKNNLQVISSLLDLQSQQIREPKMLAMFQDSCNRVRSMALVHENLYQSKNFARVNFTKYIQKLVWSLFQIYGVNDQQIILEQELDEVVLSIDTGIPCGLIINELVSNALKYAFPNQTKGTIYIRIYADEDKSYTLIVRDDGIGLSADWDRQTVNSLGLQLVKILANQLEGTLEVNSHCGTEFRLRFRELSSSKTHNSK